MSERLEEFHRIISAAIAAGASDVHIKANRPIVVRINGALVNVDFPPPTEQWMNDLVAAILSRHLEKRFAEECEVDFSYEQPGLGRIRGNAFRQRGSVVCAFRLVNTAIKTLAELNLPATLPALTEHPVGLILIAGATGSGKSTTLAAMIEHLNARFAKHIITLEDPIEFVFAERASRIEQREVGMDTRSFGAGLKHVLRQDPDVIAIGELRDAESFSAALRAVNTGHLVLTTLHASSAAQSISRVMEFFPSTQHEQVRRQLAGALTAVVCQKLVTTLDGSLIPATELLLGNLTVRKLIESGAIDSLSNAMGVGVDEGMHTFNQSLYRLTQEKKITQAEALAESPNMEALRMNFQGIFVDASTKRILGAGPR